MVSPVRCRDGPVFYGLSFLQHIVVTVGLCVLWRGVVLAGREVCLLRVAVVDGFVETVQDPKRELFCPHT